MDANARVPVQPKFAIVNNTWNRGMHDILIRHNVSHSSAFTVTVEEMQQLFDTMFVFLAPLHAECEHWCRTQACNVDCGDAACEECEMDLT